MNFVKVFKDATKLQRIPSCYSCWCIHRLRFSVTDIKIFFQAFTNIGRFSNFLINIGNFSNFFSPIQNFRVLTKVFLRNTKIGSRWLHVSPASMHIVAETRIDQGSSWVLLQRLSAVSWCPISAHIIILK